MSYLSIQEAKQDGDKQTLAQQKCLHTFYRTILQMLVT